MRDEVYMVVRFVATKLIADRLPKHITAKICETLTRELYKKFDKHWHPRNPLVSYTNFLFFLLTIFKKPFDRSPLSMLSITFEACNVYHAKFYCSMLLYDLKMYTERASTSSKKDINKKKTIILFSHIVSLAAASSDILKVGNGYRAITSSSGKLDKLLRMAFLDNGVKLDVAARFMPADFAIWCDPGDVSVRLGQDGSVWSVEHATAPTEAPSIPRNAYPGANNDLVPKSKHLDISPMSITPIKISQPQGRSRLGLRSGCPPVGWTSNKVLGDVSNIRTFRTMVAA